MDIKTSKFLRGIALLMVVGSHYALWMFAECVHPQIREFVMELGVFGVDIFFLVSGYGLVKSTRAKGINGEYIAKRLWGVYVPYILMVVTCYVMDNGLPRGNDLRRLITGFDYWYIYVQLTFYIMFALCYLMNKYRVVALTLAIAVYTYCLWAEGRSDFWELSNLAFLVGVYLAEAEYKWEGIWKKPASRVMLPLVGIVGTIVFIYTFRVYGGLSLEMLRSLFFTIAVAGVAINIKGFGVVLCTLGNYSLYIYILHTRFFGKFVMMNEEWSYFERSLFAFVLTVVICIPLGYIMDGLVNKIKIKLN